MKPKVLALTGCTASGKSGLAMKLALEYPVEIVCMDSMQIYRRMDIGTAKPTLAEQKLVPHHMLDILEPEESYAVARYVEDAERVFGDIWQRGKIPLLVGGTGLYLKSLLHGMTLGQQESDDGTPTVRKGRVSVSASKGFQRDYPYGRFAAAVLGFCNADGQGVYGLENSYESTLAGVNGRTITLRNAYGNAIADENATTYAAKDGSNLVLSLDVNIQEVVERYLNEAVAANTVENRGCAIVMNVKTGAILAMASKPDFDPNDPQDFSANLAYLTEQV